MNMTEKAKEESEIYGFCFADVSHSASLNREGGFYDGYNKGFADALEIERVPSDEMLKKIIYYLDKGYYICPEFDGSSYIELVEYLKEKLYEE